MEWPVRPQLRRPRQEGQSLVEFAMVLPVFLLVMVGLFDAGRLVYTNSVLSQAAREGVRLAATEAAWIGVPGSGCVSDASGISAANPGAHVCPPDVSAFRANVASAVNRMAVSLGPITAVHLSCNDGTEADPVPSGPWTDAPGGEGNGCLGATGTANSSSGDLVSVRVEYTYEPLTPIIGSIIPSVPLVSSATMEVH